MSLNLPSPVVMEVQMLCLIFLFTVYVGLMVAIESSFLTLEKAVDKANSQQDPFSSCSGADI